MQQILITNSHPDGFAFALTEAGEQIFIPPYAIDGAELQRGKHYQAVLIENHKEHQRERTPWMAVSVLVTEHTLKSAPAPAAEPEPVKSPYETPLTAEELDEAVHEMIRESGLVTSGELAEHLDVTTTTAGNSATRLFNAGKISKADVYAKVGQSRPSFILWASRASDFLEEIV
jgi:hypothetical protein